MCSKYMSPIATATIILIIIIIIIIINPTAPI